MVIYLYYRLKIYKFFIDVFSSVLPEMIDDDMPNGVVSSTVSASAENGPLGKRARTKSPVWERFTKLFNKAKAVLAVCNHCYKVMKGDSSQGTSHLKRHKCHCNH
jgi:hypothetical protein